MKTKDEIASEKYGHRYYGEKTKYADLCSYRQKIVDQLFDTQAFERQRG
jgi:hypothetical protein